MGIDYNPSTWEAEEGLQELEDSLRDSKNKIHCE